jgi:hypothetical protein
MEENVIFEVKVRYDNGQVARFVIEDRVRALETAQTLAQLPAARRVWVNKLTIELLHTWEV